MAKRLRDVCALPDKGIIGGLYDWLYDQRCLNDVGRLRPDRLQRLQAAGLPWSPPRFWRS